MTTVHLIVQRKAVTKWRDTYEASHDQPSCYRCADIWLLQYGGYGLTALSKHMKTGSKWTCVNAIRSDTSSAVRWVWETREATDCQFLQSLSSTQKDQTSQCVNPEMIQKQQGVSGLTHPVDDESTSRPNGWRSRHQCRKMQNISFDIHKEVSRI